MFISNIRVFAYLLNIFNNFPRWRYRRQVIIKLLNFCFAYILSILKLYCHAGSCVHWICCFFKALNHHFRMLVLSLRLLRILINLLSLVLLTINIIFLHNILIMLPLINKFRSDLLSYWNWGTYLSKIIACLLIWWRLHLKLLLIRRFRFRYFLFNISYSKLIVK
jgi:hypothetical protein